MLVIFFPSMGRAMRLGTIPTILVAILMVSIISGSSSAQIPTTPPAVEIECGDDPVLDVHPQRYEPVVMQCTVTNPSSFEETISLEKEWDGIEVSMTLSEDELTLAAGEEETIDVTFDGQTRISSTLSWDYEISAQVTTVGMVPWDNFGANASATGDVTVAEYGMVELLVGNPSKRTLEADSNFNITFSMRNLGNADDMITVSVTNTAELESAGFSFPQTSFVKENVIVDGQSTVRQIDLRTPADITEDVEVSITLEASSGNDNMAETDSITINLLVQPAATTVGGVDLGLSSVSSDDLMLYGYIGGGFLMFIFLLVIITRISRRRGSKEIVYDVEDEEDVSYQSVQTPVSVEDEFDEFDDMFSDIGDDDLDAAFADL